MLEAHDSWLNANIVRSDFSPVTGVSAEASDETAWTSDLGWLRGGT